MIGRRASQSGKSTCTSNGKGAERVIHNSAWERMEGMDRDNVLTTMSCHT